ncbi:MAG: thioredoxin reductase [Solirubrobacteraceae bacterium]|nr:thioredoxin reductase [Solirubrobacteraceae bacterium]
MSEPRSGPPVETPDVDGAFPRLTPEQIAALEGQGERRPTQEGEILFREGDERYDFFVVLKGLVAVVDDYGGEDRLIAVHGAGRFLGELGLLTGQAAFFTAVVREPGEVLVVAVERVRQLVAQDSALGDLLLRAYLQRREMLVGLGAGFKIVGSSFSPDTRRLREFAARNRLPHRWIDLERDESADALLRGLEVAPEETPVVVWHGDVLRNPSNAELARAIGLQAPENGKTLCDLVVVGAGPAGLAASVYGASEGLSTVTLEGVATGGQASTSARIENYLGFPSGLSGGELAERATLQAQKFGARITVPAIATSLVRRNGHYAIGIQDGPEVLARSVVIATGAQYRKLPVARLEEFEGTSVYYAATHMEAQWCRGDPVAVVGGGNSAGQATVFLARHASRVHLVALEDDLGRNMSRYLADRIERTPNVEVHLETQVRELVGEGTLQAVVVEGLSGGGSETLEARSLFVFIGASPHTGWLGDLIDLDAEGFVETEGNPLLLETNQPGVFAAGDVRHGSIKRVASAVGEGAMAVRFVHEHLDGRHREPQTNVSSK